MSHVIFSPAAIADIDGIWDYTAETWGSDQADLHTDDIQHACEALASGVQTGRSVDLRDGYFKYAVGKHFVFFVMADDGIAVIRVPHQQMDAGMHLS